MHLDKKFLSKLLNVDEVSIGAVIRTELEVKTEDQKETFKGLLDIRLKKKASELEAALTKEDAVGTVVLAHLYIEHELEDFIFFAAPSPDHVANYLKKRMNFFDKVALALVLGLKPDLEPALNAAGNLRNKFAHLDTKVPDDRRAQLIDFFLTLFNNIATERQRAAFEKIQNLSHEQRFVHVHDA
jgi:hypothetical protein